MNISSIVIKTTSGKTAGVIQKLRDSGLCEVHLHEDNKIVGVIEAESISDEIAVVKQINKMSDVLSAEMAFSYCEEELDEIRHNISINNDIPKWLNDDSIKAGQIDYQGDLKKKF